jgi:hypothetical protein
VRHNTYTDASDYRIDTVTYDVDNELYDINNNGDLTDDPTWTAPPGNIHLMKWLPVNTDLSTGKIWSGGYGYIDQVMIRLAEVYLDYAEALLQQDKNVSTAVEYINKVRRRGGASDITTTNKSELLDIILNERKVEFCFEGKRFFDLKRAGKLKEVLGPLGWKDYMVNYPIPQEEIDLTQMVQNSGY